MQEKDFLILPLNSIYLDYDNPRFRTRYGFNSQISQETLMQDIIKEDPSKFYDILQNIYKRNGLIKGENICIVSDAYSPNKYLALDGNRRITCLKLLTKSSDLKKVLEWNSEINLDLDSDSVKNIITLLKDISSEEKEKFKKITIPCVLFINRSEARDTLRTRHGSQERGIGRQTWGPIDNQFYQGNATLTDIISFISHNSTFSEEEWCNIKDYLWEKGASTLDYFIKNKYFKEFFQISSKKIKETSHPTFGNSPKLLIDLLSNIVKDIKDNKVNTRSHNTSEAQKCYIKKHLDGKEKNDLDQSAFFYEYKIEDDVQRPRINQQIILLNQTEELTKEQSISTETKTDISSKLIKNNSKTKFSNSSTKPSKPDSLNHNKEIEKLLNKLNNLKLISLYKSLTTIKINKNHDYTPLLTIGVWAFLETLTAVMGRNDNQNFPSFLNKNKLNNFGFDKKSVNNYCKKFDEISKKGNATKHDALDANYNTEQLKIDISVIEPVIIKCIEEAIEEKEKNLLANKNKIL